MTDWLTRQAARTLDAISVLQPNLASRFAPVQSGEAIAWGEITSTVTSDRTEIESDQIPISRPPLIQSVSSHTRPFTRVPRLKMRSPLPTVSSTWSDPQPSHESSLTWSDPQPSHKPSTVEDIESAEPPPAKLQPSTEINALSSELAPVQLDVVQPLIAPHPILTSQERSPRLEPKTNASIDSTQNTPSQRQIATSNSKITNTNEVQSFLSDASNADFLNPVSQNRSQLIPNLPIQSSEKSNLTASKTLLGSEKQPESSEKLLFERDRFAPNQTLVSRSKENLNTPVEFFNDAVLALPNRVDEVNQSTISSRQKSDLNVGLSLFSDTPSSSIAIPTIQVTIGRIEVRTAAQPQPSKRSSAPQAPALSLKDYLKQRQGG